MEVRRFTGRVEKNPNGAGFVVEMEMMVPTFDEASQFCDWIKEMITSHAASVGVTVAPTVTKKGVIIQ